MPLKTIKKKYKEKMVSMPSKFDDGFCFVQVWEKSKWECNAKNIWINEKKTKKTFVCVDVFKLLEISIANLMLLYVIWKLYLFFLAKTSLPFLHYCERVAISSIIIVWYRSIFSQLKWKNVYIISISLSPTNLWKIHINQ